MNTNINFQLGLLHFVHLLIHADGLIDKREQAAILAIKKEEQIPDEVINRFEKDIANRTEKEIYNDGINFLNQCTDEEKLTAVVHLYRLAQADDSIHAKEVRLLWYAMKVSHIDFDDVVLSANLAQSKHEFPKE